MKKSLHPVYYQDVKIVCACGHTFITGSTVPGPIRVEICSNCHPFFTGEKRLVDTEGRVEQYQRRVTQAEQSQRESQERQSKKKGQEKKSEQARTLTLKELMEEMRA